MSLPPRPSIDTKSEYIQPLTTITPSTTLQTIDVVMYDGIGVIFSNFNLFNSFTVNGNQIHVTPIDYAENQEPIYVGDPEYTYAWYITGDATLTAIGE